MNGLQNAFFKLVVPPAQAAQRKWGIPASVTIAQSILESSNQLGWGQSQLAREANNYFGIKAEHLAKPGTYVEFPTKEYVHGKIQVEEADFARYEDVNGSFEAHAKLLAVAQRYRPAMAVAKDPEAFARQLQLCDYSTNPTYASGLTHLISLYDLTQYDVPPDPTATQAKVA